MQKGEVQSERESEKGAGVDFFYFVDISMFYSWIWYVDLDMEG